MNYIQVDRALKDDPRVYPSGLDGFGVIITLGLIAAEKYGANGHVNPPFSSAIHVARHANTEPDRALAALTSLTAHKAITGSQEDGWVLAPDIWTMFAGRAIAERDRKRTQRADAKGGKSKVEPPLRKSAGQSPKLAARPGTVDVVPGTNEEVPGQSAEGCPTIQPATHPANRHNYVGCTDGVHGETAPRPEGQADGPPPLCGRCESPKGNGLLYRKRDEGWEVACCPDCTREGSLFKTDLPQMGMVPLLDADGDDWVPRSGTPAGELNDYDSDQWANDVRQRTQTRLARKD